MSTALFQSIWTVIAFVVFIAIVIWAWSGKSKKKFEDASRMAVDDDKAVSEEQRRGEKKA